MSKSTVQLEISQAIWSRRQLLKSGVGLLAGLSGLTSLRAFADVPHIVVVGGGFGGATAAKYLKIWGKDTVNVTLIEPNDKFSSPILSGMVVTSQLEVEKLDFGYSRLTGIHGVNLVKDRVTAVDSAGKTVTLSDGVSTISYDRLILAPGIDFIDVPGWDKTKLPHAWSGREQLVTLQQQLADFPVGGTLVIKVPKLPYRCPPGPYERASTVADYLRVNNKKANVIVLDAQPEISIEADMFHALYTEFGVEYRPNIEVISVNSGDAEGNGRSVTFSQSGGPFEIIEADVINLIADHKAGSIIFDAGLNVDNWAPINPLTYESTVAGKENIYILGDSQATTQVKGGQAANAQAKICVDAILRTMAGDLPYATPITTVGCSAPVTQSKINWAGKAWRFNSGTGLMEVSAGNAAPEPSEVYLQPMLKWANNLFADTFG
ncbi:cytochrome c [Thiomicrorhabdus immobilis]|uniref:Cytochrome c n=1 Tax=Thiomicrorhabdus immobilis TaxID=2791037 RepID=A0ABN6CYK4_9GAMM|nr:FAD/NAD(P)-binding oxidoreductase [Thiomicrorhabdus immobilis]BCN94192.1 cytochrome c [Thiomicrorhabdus immobilis]